MHHHKGYLCENCGISSAKYEARSMKEGKNFLVCLDCLKKLSSIYTEPSQTLEVSSSFDWSTDSNNEESPNSPSM